MRQHVHIASRRRDERLALIRKLTVWITGGAATASLGLGTVFAQAASGHAASTQGAGTPAGSSSRTPSATSTRHSQQTQLSQPAQQPTQTTAPPVVTSGGS